MQKLYNMVAYLSPIKAYRVGRFLIALTCALVCVFSASSLAQNTSQTNTKISKKKSNEVITITSTVTGNQEQPNEIYIVPWKSEIDRTILYQTLDTRLENVFGHIERREHIRQLDLIKSLSETKAAK